MNAELKLNTLKAMKVGLKLLDNELQKMSTPAKSVAPNASADTIRNNSMETQQPSSSSMPYFAPPQAPGQQSSSYYREQGGYKMAHLDAPSQTTGSGRPEVVPSATLSNQYAPSTMKNTMSDAINSNSNVTGSIGPNAAGKPAPSDGNSRQAATDFTRPPPIGQRAMPGGQGPIPGGQGPPLAGQVHMSGGQGPPQVGNAPPYMGGYNNMVPGAGAPQYSYGGGVDPATGYQYGAVPPQQQQQYYGQQGFAPNTGYGNHYGQQQQQPPQQYGQYNMPPPTGQPPYC